MELALIIWLVTSLTSALKFFTGFGILCGLLAMIGYLLSFLAGTPDSDKEKQERIVWHRNSFRLAVTAVVLSFITVILPSTQTGWMMVGGYTAQHMATSDTAKKLGKIVESKLEEVLDEATKQAKIKAGSINEKKE